MSTKRVSLGLAIVVYIMSVLNDLYSIYIYKVVFLNRIRDHSSTAEVVLHRA